MNDNNNQGLREIDPYHADIAPDEIVISCVGVNFLFPFAVLIPSIYIIISV